MHPSSEVEREYLVQVRGVPSAAVLEQLRLGLMLEDGPARFDSVVPIREPLGRPPAWGAPPGTGDGAPMQAAVQVVLHEGRNREVRRLWQAAGFEVSRLMRLRYGSVRLPPDLRPGQCRPMPAAQAALL